MAFEAYRIDNQDVNGLPDWRHTPPVSPSPDPRQEIFPGDGTTFTLVSQPRGPRFAVTGWLLANSWPGLHQSIREADAMRFDRDLHTVTIHTNTYADCQLVRFEVLTGPSPITGSSGVLLRNQVRWTWQQLTAGGAA